MFCLFIFSFILAEKARKYVTLSPEERKQRIAQIYSKVFNCEEALYVSKSFCFSFYFVHVYKYI